MLNKPFRPPLLVQKPRSSREVECISSQEVRLPKRRRIDEEGSSLPATDHNVKYHDAQPLASTQAAGPIADGSYYNVLWRKPSNKKHKTWDGDGVLAIKNGYATLSNESGKDIGSIKHTTPLFTGSTLFIAGREVEVESSLSKQDYLSGRQYIGATGKPTVRELDEQLRTNVKFNAHGPAKTTSLDRAKPSKQEDMETIKPLSTPSQALQNQFRNPVLVKSDRPESVGNKPVPRHDPNAANALVMKRPSQPPPEKRIVDVVVDPMIANNLRHHQREGVKFMYECIMGLKPQGVNGAILADEMGLGKTLQVIALIWTLLKQNPISEDPPVVKKAVVVCPATVIKNWRKEFRKWVGESRIGVFILDGQKARLKDFTHGRAYNVMIVGYERLRIIQDELQKCKSIDLVIADEGHRLKTANNKSAQAIKSLGTDRRILLSGTPLQNELSEFYFAVDMVNPGLLGKANTFKREFELPIMRSRQPEATAKEIEKGKARSAELAELTGMFMLRRTSNILTEYLPSKTETILFCRPTSAQARVYKTVLASPTFGAILRSPETAFKLINILKKLCNSPSLLKGKKDSNDIASSDTLSSLLSEVPSNLLQPGASGKLQVLDSLLHLIRTQTTEKVVIVSHYTSTLDIIGSLLDALSYTHLRLDGTTPVSKRQSLVDKFNTSDASEYFAFLLSAKSGGAGINLIGASRLILYDVDWNPSTDEQAMARIHRDGQKRHCWIYRLLTQGALDEKIFQRQVAKRALAEEVVDGKVSASTFTAEELRRLFRLDEDSECQTHALLACGCGSGAERLVVGEMREGEGEEENAETEDEKTVETEEESDGGMPDLPTLMKASEVDVEVLEKTVKKRTGLSRRGHEEKDKMLALMQYEHIAPKHLSSGEQQDSDRNPMLADDILETLLKDTEHKIGYIFTKTKVGGVDTQS